jgi:hypothetical protein
MTTAAFMLNGKIVNPFYRSNWDDAPDEFHRHLEGDFFCLPFGIAPQRPISGWEPETPRVPAREYPHGYSANGIYEVVEQSGSSVTIRLDYDSPDVNHITRTVTLHELHVDFIDTVYAKREFSAPVGLHPIFALPEDGGVCEIGRMECREFRTYPIPVDDSSVFQNNAIIADMYCVPLKNGGALDASRLPLEIHTEELLLAVNVEKGRCALANRGQAYEVTLTWDERNFPHCMFWMSNYGRQDAPWHGENLCLGIEPIASAFDLGSAVSTAENPLLSSGAKTYQTFSPDKPAAIAHSVSVQAI